MGWPQSVSNVVVRIMRMTALLTDRGMRGQPTDWLELNGSAVLHSTINIKYVYDSHTIRYAYI